MTTAGRDGLVSAITTPRKHDPGEISLGLVRSTIAAVISENIRLGENPVFFSAKINREIPIQIDHNL